MISHKQLYLPISASLFCSVCFAEEPAGLIRLSQNDVGTANTLLVSPVVITATRVEHDSFNLPVSIDVVDAEKIQEGQLQVNISESLARVPGIVAQSRGQYAQDVQISSRGFGARSQFGVRGIRLYADGIPLTMPDGQGQAGTFDLGSAKSIEVMRGPFSALYGNSSGGVVQIFTADGPKDPTLSGAFTAGSYGTRNESLKFGGTAGDVNYLANYSHLESDGYRDHSAVRRDLFNAKLGIRLNEDTHMTIIATDFDEPVAQDPLGLTKLQWQQNPRQAGTNALKFNTRVARSHSQVGAKIEHDLDANNAISLMGYGGVRKNEQFLPTAVTAQGIASSGGVSRIDRDFAGLDLRYTHKGLLAERPYNIAFGVNYDTMTDDRTGYQNFVGTTLGIIGALRRDETNSAKNFDQYVQGEWSPHDRWNIVAGVRHSTVKINSDDHFIVPGNGNDSGSVDFQKTTPVAGVIFKVTPELNIYANAGKGFETPTLIEMAYRADGTTGLNFGLQPSTSNNYEIGTKAFLGSNTRANLAMFLTDTNNEIVTATNAGGRTTYQNAGGTQRSGLELSVDSEWGHGFTTYAAYSYINAKYTDAF
ncbi:MAG: TonB-dependent receptor, partial [Pseudomonadota bacterium]